MLGACDIYANSRIVDGRDSSKSKCLSHWGSNHSDLLTPLGYFRFFYAISKNNCKKTVWCFSPSYWKSSCKHWIPRSHIGTRKMNWITPTYLMRRLIFGYCGVVYTMGPWSCPKALQNMWLAGELISEPLRFTPRKKSHRDHGFRGPQKTYYKAYIIHWHGPMGFALGEAN